MIDLTNKNVNKGKKKVVGIHINEPPLPPKNIFISKVDLELEIDKKEREDMAKDLEKVENKAEVAETRRKIQFIKSTSCITTWQNQTS